MCSSQISGSALDFNFQLTLMFPPLKSALKCTFISYTQRPSNTDATPAMIMGISTHKCCHVNHHKLIFAEAFEHGHICNRVNNGTFEMLRMLKYEKPYFELMNV